MIAESARSWWRGARGRSDWIAVAVLIALVSAWWWDVLFAGACFYLRDLTHYYYPSKLLVREALLAGELPLWNRAFSCGQPLAANPDFGVFYPLQWLTLLPDYQLGYRLHIVAHFYLAALGAYALLRDVRLSVQSALFGAILFAFGGPLVSLTNLLPIFYGAAWFPVVMLFARRFAIRPRARDFALGAMCLGVQATSGEPATLVQTWGLVACYACWRGWRDGGGRGALRATAGAAGLVAAGALLGGVQLAAAFDLARETIRAKGLPLAEVMDWSMPPWRPLEVLFAHLLGNGYTRDYETIWGNPYARGTPFIGSFNFGSAAAALLCAGAVLRRRGWVPLAALAGLASLFAVGEYTPFVPWLHEIGLLRAVRFPEKAALAPLLVLPFFAAIACEGLAERQLARTAKVAALLLAAAAGLLALYPRATGVSQPAPFAFGMLLSAAGFLFVAALFRLGVLAPRSLPWTRTGLIVCSAAELLLLREELAPRRAREFFDPPPVVAELRRDRSRYRIFNEPEWHMRSPTARRYWSLGSLGGARYDVFRNGLFSKTPAAWGFRMAFERDADFTLLNASEEMQNAMLAVKGAGRRGWEIPFVRMAAIGYRAAFRPFDEEIRAAGGDPSRLRPVVFLPQREGPMYRFATRLLPGASGPELAKRLLARDRPNDADFVPFAPFVPASGVVRRVEETGHSVRLDVEAYGNAYLVASVTGHRYWQAEVDGAPVPVVPTNVAFQGITIPAGRHIVTMHYRNPVILCFAALSMLVGAVLLGLLAAGRRRRA